MGECWNRLIVMGCRLVLLQFLIITRCCLSDSGWDDFDDDPVSTIAVDAVLGRTASLPCDIRPSPKNDRVYMVFWFKSSAHKPLYSYDVRGRSLSEAKHWSEPEPLGLGQRASFSASGDPAVLLVDQVRLEDEGVYRCRVDFQKTPTRNFQINLTVIVPPDQLKMYDISGRELSSVVGPLTVGKDLYLRCEVRGGKPAPTLSWFVNERLKEETVSPVGRNALVSKLEIRSLSRDHLNSTYKCQASNTKLVLPIERTVRLEMNLKPVSVTILDKPAVLVSNHETPLTCQVKGSRPRAEITWLKDNARFEKGEVREWGNETVTFSTLHFVPRPEDDAQILRCRAINKVVENSISEDHISLNIVYRPRVSLHLGSTLNGEDIKEGDDVYFECIIRANPRENKIFWYLNGAQIWQNVSSGVILSTHSLVLQGVNRKHGGSYTCLASNEQGETASQSLNLRVKFAPVCSQETPTIIGASLHESIHVRCVVMADPPEVSFEWFFRNSGEAWAVAAGQFRPENGSSNELLYRPSSERDYGTLTCRGINVIGKQIDPCVFQIVPAVRPSAVRNCTLRSTVNASGDWLEVECAPGYDGGLPQTFHLEAVDSDSMRLRLNLSNPESPFFHLDLASLTNIPDILQLIIYPANQKGRGEPYVLEEIVLRDAERRIEWLPSGSSKLGLGQMAGFLIGAAATLCIVVLVVMVIVSKRRQQLNHQLHHETKQLELINRDDQRYIISYQLKPEPKQPDILSRDDNILDRESALCDSKMATAFISPSMSPIVSERGESSSNSYQDSSHASRPQTIALSSVHSMGSLKKTSSNGTLRAKNQVITSTIPGPESCV
ncbi:kin of IRRE-like protein 3 isoform X2 [Bemisia tabaci]|uniref:kin of IRRE-like protein 3 isoform X2 n=1 Tax=Bemisia tabaci TaxID=7038 RepID=UPI003B28867D